MATGQDLLGLDEFPGTGPVPDDTQLFGKSPRIPGKEFRVPASRLPGGFLPLLASELNADKVGYAGLALRPLLIKLVNAIGTGVIATPLATPTGLSVVAMSSSNGASWNAVPNVSAYRLQRAPVASDGTIGSYGTVYEGANTSYADTTATAGQKYAYRVKALGTGNYTDSGYSTPVQVTTAGGGSVVPKIRVMHTYGQSLIPGTGPVEDLDTTTLADVTPSLKREFQKGYIWNRPVQDLQKYQASVNAQGFDPTGQGKICFGSEIGMFQRMEELYPNDIFVVLKGGKANESIESLMAGGGTFEAVRDEVWTPGWAAVMVLAQQVGATQVISMGLHFNQAQTQLDSTIDTYYANQDTLLKQQLRPCFYGAAQGVDDSNFKFLVADIVKKPNFTAVKHQWVADNSTIAVSVEAWRLVHRDDDVHLTGISHFTDGYNSIFKALGLVTLSNLFMRLRPARAGNAGNLARDFSGWHNALIAKAGEEAVLATNPKTGLVGFTVSASHIAKLTPRTAGGVQRMENVPKRTHFAVEQGSTGALIEYLFCNLGKGDLLPGFNQGIVALDGTYIGGPQDLSTPGVISVVQGTVGGTPTSTVLLNGNAVGSKAAPFYRLEGEANGFALLSPPTNNFDDQAAKPGAWVLGMDSYVGEATATVVGQEINALAADTNISGTATPPAPKGYQATYTDTVPADA